MKRKTTYTAFFIVAALVLGLSVFLMPGCSSSDNTVNENSIQGTVTDSESGTKLEGVTVAVGDNSTTTDSNGFYKLSGFVGGRHIIKASKDRYGNYSAEVIVSSWQPTTHNFSMTGNTGETKVLGTVTDSTWNPTGVEGVIVTVGGKSATTDSEGKYEISDVEVKNMTLTATKDNYVDYSADIDVAEGTTTTHNFIMVMNGDVAVTFLSRATNLTTLMPTPSPTNTWQVYVRKKYESKTEPVSLASPNVLAPGYCYDPSISANGRYVVYRHNAISVGGGPSGSAFSDIDGIFVYDLFTGETELVSKKSDGTPGNSDSYVYPQRAVSADGRYVTFSSSATNLVDGDDNGYTDIFIHDRETGITQKASNSLEGGSVNDSCYYPAISADGRYVAFHSNATNIVEGTSTSRSRVYVYDTQTKTITHVSVNDNGEEANSTSYNSFLSGDGRYVVFASNASNLVTSDGAGSLADNSQIYLRDRTAGTTTLISKNSSGTPGSNGSYWPAISADGRYVTFYSYSTNLDDAATNGNAQIYLHDRTTGETILISKNGSGVQGDGYSYTSKPFNAGDLILFESSSTNLVENDTNSSYDVFVYYIKTGIVERLSLNSSGEEGNATSYLYDD